MIVSFAVFTKIIQRHGKCVVISFSVFNCCTSSQLRNMQCVTLDGCLGEAVPAEVIEVSIRSQVHKGQ